MRVVRHRPVRAAGILLVVACVASACTGGKPDATPTTPASSPPPPTAPLTGLEVASAAIAERPALAVKIDNAVAARPQLGLDRADIVYEEPVEGGITRFLAIFQSRDASKVGPIRSARLADIDILRTYGTPILSFSGAAGYVSRRVARADLVSLEHGRNGSLYERERGRPSPHNLFSGTKKLYRAARGATTPASPFQFGELPDPPASSASPGSPSPSPSPAWRSARRVTVPFSSSSWTAVWRWDRSDGVYERSHGSTPHRTTRGRRVTAENVLVLTVRTRAGRADSAGNPTPEIVLTGSGRAVLVRDGVMISGTWSRASVDAAPTFTDRAGRPFVFAPGNTWVELAPRDIRPRYS